MSIIKQIYKPSMTVGPVYARPYGSTQQPMPIGNVLELSLEHNEEVQTQDDMTRMGGGTHAEVRRVKEVKVTMKLADLNVTNMARGLLGAASVVASGTVEDEPHAATLGGLLLLSVAPSFGWLLVAAVLVGTGSSVFHPESSRVARMASGGRHGLAQSLFQVGGNVGSALGPLLAALFIIPHGQRSVAWFSLAALFGIVVLTGIGRWYSANRVRLKPRARREGSGHGLTRNQVLGALGVLGLLVFSKYFYLASLNSYFTFYLIDKFALSVREAQLYLFLFLAAVAVGTVVGGPVGDRIGRKIVIWVSILGVAPFTLLLPHANLFWTGVLVVIIGVVLASAFSAIVVYAQELVPGKVGMIAGLFFGFAFGMGGLGAAALGKLADATSIGYVYQVCAYLPLLGVVAVLLPSVERKRA